MGYRLGQWHVSLTMVFVILGFLLATAFSTQQTLGERSAPRKNNLIQFIKKQRGERDKLGNQLIEIRKELDNQESRQVGSEGILATSNAYLEELRVRSGLSEVSGPGLEIVLGDAPRVPLGAEPDSFLIHDYDLQIVINALWRGGAEAIAVNGERFVANTGIRSAGSTVLINSKPQGVPYRIKAIGKVNTLEKLLKQDSDAALLLGQYAQDYGLVAKVVRKKKLKLPPYKGSLNIPLPEEQ